jgi:hypothetical protein
LPQEGSTLGESLPDACRIQLAQRIAKSLHVLGQRPARCFEDKMRPIPRSVLPGKRFFPGRQPQSGQIRVAGFHPAPMFFKVGALDLDFHRADLGARGNLDPRIAGELDGIHGVRNHRQANSEVILGERVCNSISRVVERPGSVLGRAHGLLDRVNSQMNCS